MMRQIQTLYFLYLYSLIYGQKFDKNWQAGLSIDRNPPIQFHFLIFKKANLLLFLGIIFTFLASKVLAQPGVLDSTFGTNGIATTPLEGDYVVPRAIIVQPDGKIIAAGHSDNDGFLTFTLVRYNQDGTLDNDFGSAGKVSTLIGVRSAIYSIAQQPDGKIVVAGEHQPDLTPSATHIAAARYLANGTLDTSFGTDGIVTAIIGNISRVHAIAIQVDSKIVLIGYSSSGNPSKNKITLLRYNHDGTFDNNFGDSGMVITEMPTFCTANAGAVQTDGKIVVAGNLQSEDFSVYQTILTRYDTNGSLDETFNVDGIITTLIGLKSLVVSLVLQPDGKIIVGGSTVVSQPNPFYYHFALARYNTNGDLDSSFGSGGIVTTAITQNSEIHSIALQADGKIVAGGGAWNTGSNNDEWGLTRYGTDGSLDESFGNNGFVTSEYMGVSIIHGVAIQPDGKIVATGTVGHSDGSWNNYTDFNVARYLPGPTVAIKEFSISEHSLLVYPNPVIRNAILEYSLYKEAEISIGLYDILGKKIKTFIRNEKQGIGSYKQSLVLPEGLAAGCYDLMISTANEHFTVKLIK